MPKKIHTTECCPEGGFYYADEADRRFDEVVDWLVKQNHIGNVTAQTRYRERKRLREEAIRRWKVEKR